MRSAEREGRTAARRPGRTRWPSRRATARPSPSSSTAPFQLGQEHGDLADVVSLELLAPRRAEASGAPLEEMVWPVEIEAATIRPRRESARRRWRCCRSRARPFHSLALEADPGGDVIAGDEVVLEVAERLLRTRWRGDQRGREQEGRGEPAGGAARGPCRHQHCVPLVFETCPARRGFRYPRTGVVRIVHIPRESACAPPGRGRRTPRHGNQRSQVPAPASPSTARRAGRPGSLRPPAEGRSGSLRSASAAASIPSRRVSERGLAEAPLRRSRAPARRRSPPGAGCWTPGA